MLRLLAAPLGGANAAPLLTFRSRGYRFLWTASLIWNHARWMEMVVLGWVVLEITDSAWHVAIVGVLRSLPIMLFGVFGGAVADRIDRRQLLVYGEVGGGLVTVAATVLLALGLFRFEHAVVVALLLGLQWAIAWPARRALIPDLVGRELTVNAVALESVSMNISKIIGPLAAGSLLAYAGPAAGYFSIVVLFVVEIALLVVMPLPPRTVTAGGGPMLRYLREGLAELRLSQPIMGVLWITVFMNMLAFPHQTLLPVFARDVLYVDAVGLGMLGAASGVGSLIGALALASRGRLAWPGWLFAVGSFGMCVSLVGFALARDFGVALGALAVSGLAGASFSALQSTIILRGSSEEMRGRAMGVLTFAIGTAPLGLLEIGAVTAAFGAPFAVALNAAACAVLIALVTARLPRFRGLEQ